VLPEFFAAIKTEDKTMQVHTHPESGETITGTRLAAGAILQQNDRYNSSDGKWRPCNHTAGHRIEPNCTTIWVRPNVGLSENARTLLGYLNSRGGESYGCIAERQDVYYVLPTSTWNWDGRFELQHVEHPQCIQELVDYGYLTFGKYNVRNPESDYATSKFNGTNEVYTLTKEGKREGARILAESK
jgi:hypothetical protein